MTKTDSPDNSHIIFINPSEDNSTSVNINFYSHHSKMKITYRPSLSDDTSQEKIILLEGIKSDIECFYQEKGRDLFTFRNTISNLIPDTEYIFFLQSPDGRISNCHRFKTAGWDSTFSFGWIGDIHADPIEPDKMPMVDTMVSHLESKAVNNKLDLILVSGDMVKFGNYYEAWCQWDRSLAAANHIFATVPGNKEYYKVIDIPKDIVNEHYCGEWYENTFNNPTNNPPGIEGTYSFIYNRVLFIAINNCQEEAPGNKVPVNQKEVISSQQKWFEDTVTSLRGQYDYIIVQNHYAYFIHDYEVNPQTEHACSWGRYPDWHPLFDKYGVDFSLSGDYHEYCRSKRIYCNSVATDNDHGTVYITYSQLSDRIDELILKDSQAELVDKYEVGSSTGAGLFNVTPSEISFFYFDAYGNIVDTISIPKKKRL